ncbi:beta-N-acetylhexosaminidase [Desulfonema magnum]|uniref:beta-N-acetylhexosaminidase n=1 Tax=Desulfonema magnum TaxID=45655 RepID=A0A975BXC5_9BACT|nr:beta-N-acetylhexosaminidase [Desulfonema magnum]QTA93380.1 Beta-hexosaminidase [Desulfonema magnum]
MNITTFSKEQLAGQRVMAGFDGTDLNNDLKFLIDTLKIGGIILFTRNLSGPDQIKELCQSVQEYARIRGQPPLFIAIDQEGGQVARLKEPFTQFPGNPKMKDEADAVHFAKVTAAELTELGVNMNMAPVMDVAPEGVQSIMAERVFGHTPERVSALGTKVIRHLQNNRVMAVAKHFPGIGRTTSDSHNDMPFLNADMAALESFDLLPFEAAIKQAVAGIMLSHIFYNKIDPKWPASLSPRIAKKLLRNMMGFAGIVITDDLDMGAIKKHYDIRTVIQQILSADIDITLICHKGPNIEIAFEEILKGITDTQEIKTRGEASVRRILKLKEKYL